MTNIHLYDTLSGTKQPLTPNVPNQVSMYICGVTVYDLCHIGHGRAYVAFDTIRRFLEYVGYQVNYIQNFTDIDDKIINRSNELNEAWSSLANRFIHEYYIDMDRLNIKRANLYPKATEHIQDMLVMIQSLMDKQHAYAIDGDVYFSIESFKEYGKLSGRKLEDMQAGARVDVDQRKHHPMDFALWKKSNAEEPGWESPWGRGRPGWHIECSAMSTKYLGDTFDIHGGGADLVFPHHENEIAQAEASSQKPFAKYWLHNGFVNVNKEKMSKSLGNFFTIRDVLQTYQPEELRLFYLMTHYRKPINYSLEYLDDARKALERLNNALYLEPVSSTGFTPELATIRQEFITAMADDFNTAQAVGIIFELAKLINREKSAEAQSLLKELANVLGLLIQPPVKEQLPDQEIQALIDERLDARKNKNFARADEIRKLLDEKNILLEDTPQGTRWKKK